MKSSVTSVDVQAALQINWREAQIINHMLSYSWEDFIKARVSSSYIGGVTQAEMNRVLEALRRETANIMRQSEVIANSYIKA